MVRVADCRALSIDGGAPEAGIVAQLGVSIVSPDGTGDINNYTAWYYTTSKRLAVALRHLGVRAQGQQHDGTEKSDDRRDAQGMTLAILNDAANAEAVLQHAKSHDECVRQRNQIATPQLLEYEQTERDAQSEHEHAEEPSARDPYEVIDGRSGRSLLHELVHGVRTGSIR